MKRWCRKYFRAAFQHGTNPELINHFIGDQKRKKATPLDAAHLSTDTKTWDEFYLEILFNQFYSIKNVEEAKVYRNHPVLRKRLIETSGGLLKLLCNDANKIFGSPADMKFKSSMMLFSSVEGSDPVFLKVLDKFFGGTRTKRL